MSCITPGEEMTGRPCAKAVRTYALRIARKCFLLAHSCSEDHPVYRTELDLIEMARSALQEQILTSVRNPTGLITRADIEFKIRLIAREKIQAYSENEEVLSSALEALAQETFEDLFSYKN